MSIFSTATQEKVRIIPMTRIFDGPHATPPESDHGSIFLGISNLTGTQLNLSCVRHIADVDWPKWTKRVAPRAHDIVFSYEATLGYFALIPAGIKCCLGRRLALIRPHPKNGYPYFWYHQFTSEPFQAYLKKHSVQGATVDRIPLIDFPNYHVLRPSDPVIVRFDRIAEVIWGVIHDNQAQSRTLAALRDTLLPKLLSGELRIKDAERFVSEVV